MIYETRNLTNINKMSPHSRMAALDWYAAVKKEKIEILVYETVRSIEKQKENVANGASQTMKSYHLVGQALDFVLVDTKGTALWNGANYKNVKGKKVIELAKKFGFEWGGDWKTFKDMPHLQFRYKGYGTDHVKFVNTLHEGASGDQVKDIQNLLNITVDGKWGPKTTEAVKAYQKANGLKVDGIVGPQTFYKMFK